MNDVNQSVNDYLTYTNKVRELLGRYYTPTKKLNNGQDNPDYHPALLGDVKYAIECMVSLATVFRALETQDPNYTLSIIVDLSFGLSENPFWQKFGNVLIPVYKNALLAAAEASVFKKLPEHTDEQKELLSRQTKQWLNLPVMGYDCLYGTLKTVNVATALIQELNKL